MEMVMFEACVYRAFESVCEINRKMPEVTLRDTFAMNALNGILASPDFSGTPANIAKIAYEYADVMIEARKKKN